MLNKKSSALWMAGVAFGMSYMPTSSAQTGDTEAAPATLEEIVVTAQKREQSFQDVAISAVILTGEDLEKKGITQIQDAIRQAPGVKVQNIAGTGSGRVFIRGIGTTSGDEFDGVIANGVSLNLDGVNSNNASNLLGSMFDVERVEVLKGPQGTLYGSSALGGVVNVITAKPKHEFEAAVKFQLGNYGAKTFQQMLNIPVTEDFALRITSQQDKRDSYFDTPKGLSSWDDVYDAGGPWLAEDDPATAFQDLIESNGAVYSEAFDGGSASDNESYRVKGLWDVNEDLSLLLTYDYSENAGTSPKWLAVSDAVDNTLICCNLAPPAFATPAFHEKRYYYRENRTITADINYSIGGVGELTFTASTNKIKDKGQEATALQIATSEFSVQDQDTYELRLASPAESDIVWVAGLYHQETGRVGSSFSTSSLAASSEDDDGNTIYNFVRLGKPFENSNAYAQITYPLTDSFRLTAGGRFSQTKDGIEYMLYSTTTTDCDEDCVVDESATYKTDDGGQSNTTWKLGFELDLNDTSLLYGHVATGYKSGGVQYRNTTESITTLAALDLGSYKPEESTSYEIGTKNRFLDNTLQFNAAVFYTDWYNMQVNTIVCTDTETYCLVDGAFSTDGDNSYTAWFNADTSTQYGLELETIWLVTAADKLSASLSLMKGKYGATNYLSSAPSTATDLEEGDFVNGVVNLDGREMANTPLYSGTLSYAHTFNLFGYDLVATIEEEISAEYETTHEYFFDGHTQDAYHKTNLSLTYNLDNFTFNTYLRNLENETVITSVFPLGVQVSEPRLYGMSVSYNF